ncbi:hypothetical protein HRG_002527 [Hirsutella rhossiliensis]|uniref:Uncharacterized protein n=1 Tax=Hirsutella rhossiliensis TaxID=111463 RepID=A0A9P8N2K6_9HYPO|nr:uncharacterized protein HRG_02527 [Hirsutella rhossiliensis]KAH0967118.1 hypothetical protein HRG_02527 [Hirsutella rhossiliensis]
MKVTLATIAIYLTALGLAQDSAESPERGWAAHFSWSFDQFIADGLEQVSFPMNMANANHDDGFYFAQQFNFEDITDIGYIGLQPRKDNNSVSMIHAAFSSFQNGTTTSNKNCTEGADGGPGGSGFVEYYHWNVEGSGQNCEALPRTEVTFSIPTSKDAERGSLRPTTESGPCKGLVALQKSQVPDGWHFAAGFQNGTNEAATKIHIDAATQKLIDEYSKKAYEEWIKEHPEEAQGQN